MPILQLSVFAENKPGAMTAITRILGEAGVDIRALSLADTSDYGILRLIVDKPEQAQKALDSRGYILRISPVIGVAVPDEPGALCHTLEVLEKRGVNIEYMYAFISRSEKDAYVILRTDRHELAESVLAEAGVRLLLPDGAGVNW